MAVDASRGSMVSRSVRLHEDTLKGLEELSKVREIGVTVLIREIVEQYLNTPYNNGTLGFNIGAVEAPDPGL